MVDPSLYTGLANWLRNNELPEWLDLPRGRRDLSNYVPTPEDLKKASIVNSLKMRKYRDRDKDNK